ncbi:DUF2989 domain-containing protein [Vibrio variabilis]|uniref:DUF2989 domain-containing protein n=1 Tax=Vibrio variabilis TaxID=990271 RepID=UPI000DDBC754|nr:DUF2989 domain-containing protein [Vibrio variabilis]
MNLPHSLLVLLSASLLTGCFETRKNTDQLCEQEPALNCAVMNTSDGQCRIPRTNLIWHRYDMLSAPTEANAVQDYYLLKEYRKCLELASQIQPIEQADLKARRFNALMFTINEQDRVTQSLSATTSPDTLYFLWSETGDHAARRRFLAMEGSPQLDTPQLQYALATYYISRDKTKTYQLLNRSLMLSEGVSSVNNDVIQALASVTQSLEQPEQSYLWAMVATKFDIPIASENELRLMFNLSESTYKRLQKQADIVTKAIKSGDYTPSLAM